MSEIDAKVRRLMDNMPAAFKPEKAVGVDAIVQYTLNGEGGSTWNSRIADGACSVSEGPAEAPTLNILMDANDYVDMMAGRLDGMQAFMMGKIRVEGDIMLASRLMTFFN
ncbi:MAG: SCP2 sterol-binding domain-containing protein [Caldilineales bacterium]|nr:SCP2 sterol-binding domain-containing protein [Caldilineales bacterium]